jgi:hypothetical protein
MARWGFFSDVEALRGIMTNASDERVWNDKSSGKIFLHTDADLERVRNAWGLLFSKACEGALPSEF